MHRGRLYGVSLLSSFAVCAAMIIASGRTYDHALSELLDPIDSAVLWLAFAPGNCALTKDNIEILNRWHANGTVAVRAVMVGPPDTKQDRARVVEAFGIKFPVNFDDGTWEERLRKAGYSTTTVILSRQTSVVLSGSLDVLDLLNPAQF